MGGVGGNLINLPQFHVTRCVVSFIEIMAECERELTLEDFKGQNCAFVTEWLQQKGLQKLCTVFEGIKYIAY